MKYNCKTVIKLTDQLEQNLSRQIEYLHFITSRKRLNIDEIGKESKSIYLQIQAVKSLDNFLKSNDDDSLLNVRHSLMNVINDGYGDENLSMRMNKYLRGDKH